MTTEEFIEHTYVVMLRLRTVANTNRYLAIIVLVCTLLNTGVAIVNSINIRNIGMHDGVPSIFPKGESPEGP